MAGLMAFAARFGTEEQCVSHTWPGYAGRADSIRAALSRSAISVACSAVTTSARSSRGVVTGPGYGLICRGCGGREAWRLKARPRVCECSAWHRQGSGDGWDRVAPHARRALEVVSCRLPNGPRGRAVACCVPSVGRRVAASVWRSLVGDQGFIFRGLGLSALAIVRAGSISRSATCRCRST
jgi:hypothetical protein